MANLRRKISFLRSLIGKETAHNGPFHVTVDVTRRCNLNCIGCRYHSKAIENIESPGNQEVLDLSPALFERLCRDLAKLGTKAIELSGEGEPLVNKNLFDLIQIAKKNNLNVTVFSNGTLLDSHSVKSMIDSHLDCLKVTLWACTAEIYRNNYPGTNPDFFNWVVDGLKNLASAKRDHSTKKPAVIIHHPINRKNFRTLKGLVGLAQLNGCNEVSFSPLKTRRGRLASDSLNSAEENEARSSLLLVERELDALGVQHNIADTFRRYKIGEFVWEKLPCYIGFISARVKVDGTIVPCNPCNIVMGDLNDSSFEEIWNNSAYKAFRRRAMTSKGLVSMEADCDCGYCCFLNDNWRVHRIFKWISPLSRS